MLIKVLSPEVAAKIAAGEVIERPASVVKELVENAIDAGASAIQVDIRGGGLELIRVADDGRGMDPGDLRLALQRHATSKIGDLDDLQSVRTLGFRGEALPSIAAVARLSLVSRRGDLPAGSELQVEGGELVGESARGAAPGTVVTVRNLFFNVPARLKWMRAPSTEAAQIQSLLNHLALGYPEVRFTATSDGRPVLQSHGTGRLLDAILAVYGPEVARQMLPLEASAETGPASDPGAGAPVLHGFVGQPALHRSSRGAISLLVNRRWVANRTLLYAIEEAYQTLIGVGRHPVAVIDLRLDPAQVDVNVHPRKAEVKILGERVVFGELQKAVRRAISRYAVVPSLRPEPFGAAPAGPVPEQASFTFVPSSFDPPVPVTPGPPAVPASNGVVPPGGGNGRLPLLRVIGQTGQTYIVAEGPSGMYLVDQHAAHERVLLERFGEERDRGAVQVQALLEPLLLELDPLPRAAAEERQAELAALGLEIEPFGASAVLVRAIPAILQRGDLGAALADLLRELAERPDAADWHEQFLISLACHSAVRAGQTLSSLEMRGLIEDLERTRLPRTCAHGRPTMLHLSQAELDREFGRR